MCWCFAWRVEVGVMMVVVVRRVLVLIILLLLLLLLLPPGRRLFPSAREWRVQRGGTRVEGLVTV
jgi:hypothetical protein